MDVFLEEATGRIIKAARSAAERGRLAREAEVLGAVAHPGVVRVLAVEGGDPPDRLCLQAVGGRPLADLGPQPLEVTAGWAAAVATTVADLHDIGLAHGAISPDHVLFDESGRPVLCGFGRAATMGADSRGGTEAWRKLAEEDVAALARLVLGLLPDGPARGLRSILQRAAAGRGRSRRVDARLLARTLVERVPGARLPGPATGHAMPSRPSRPTRSFRSVKLVVAAALLATGAALAPALMPAASRRATAASRGPAPAAWSTLVTSHGRYRLVTAAGERAVSVLGRWRCSAAALPAVLDTRSGTVWLFDAWPGPGSTSVGRRVARVPRATDLGVAPGPGRCDVLDVARRARPAVTVSPKEEGG